MAGSEETHLLTMKSDAESKADYKIRWCSLCIGYVSTFSLALQVSMVWSSMFPYLQEIDKSSTETFYGLIVSATAFGAIVSAPLLGIISKKTKSIKIPVLLGFSLNITGNLFLVFVEEVKDNRKWTLLGGRILEGLGTGCRAVLSAYTVMATRLDERNKALSIEASSFSAGTMAGPGIQALAAAVTGYPGYKVGALRLSMYTTPPFACILWVSILAILIIVIFKECNIDLVDVSVARNEIAGVENAKYTIQSESDMPSYDKLAAFACAYTYFCSMFSLTYIAVISSPLSIIMFNWSLREAVLYNGILLACTGIVAFVGNLLVGNIVLKYINERLIMIVGLSAFLLSYAVSFSYPYILPQLITSNVTTNVTATCDYIWCTYTTRIYPAQHIIAYVLVGIAISSGITSSKILLSKVVGPRHQVQSDIRGRPDIAPTIFHLLNSAFLIAVNNVPQQFFPIFGVMQGLNMAGGQAALILGPAILSAIFQSFGPRVSWGVAASVLISGIILNLLMFSRLVPYNRLRIIIAKSDSQSE